jgi:hypothetical protein
MDQHSDEALEKLGLVGERGMFVDELRQVGVVAGEFGIVAGWLDVAWDGPADPARQLRDVVHVPFPRSDVVDETLRALRAKREARLVACAFCGAVLPPGRVHRIDGRVVCHGCAERHLAVVH